MDGHYCIGCKQFWASQAGPPDRFSVITRLCPYCVAKTYPIVDVERVVA